MKQLLAVLALAVFFAVGCNEDPNTSPGSKVNNPGDPTSAKTGGTSDAVFDIPAPTFSGASGVVQGDAVGSGYSISVCWTYQTPANSYYTSTLWYPQGTNKPAKHLGLVPTATLNPGAQNSPYEFWGGSQKTIVSAPSYSGHYDVERSINGGTWSEIAETRSLCYTDNNGGNGFAVGTVVEYRIKEKSLEADGANQSTHHSNYSGTGSVTITDPCTEDAIADSYAGPFGVLGDNVNWDGSNFTCQNANEQVNPHWTITVYTRTQNSCTGEITITGESEYTGDLCVTIDGGATYHEAHWQSGKYHIDGNLDNPGTGTYTMYMVKQPCTAGTLDMDMVVGVSIMTVP